MKEIRLTKKFDNGLITDEYTVAEIKAEGYNKFMDWTCMVGMNSLYIDFDGMVWRGPCRVGRPLGNMLGDWKIPVTPVECTRWTCDCGTGIKLPKWQFNKRHEEMYRLVPIEEQVFNVQWDLGRRCNFDCSYCWPSSHNKTDKWLPSEVYAAVVDKICERYDGKMQFNFAGGEPTLHLDFPALCAYIRFKGHHVHVQTNGSMSEVRAAILANVAEISISVHFEFTNIEKLVRNVIAILGEPNHGLEIKMMIDSTEESQTAAMALKERLKSVPNIEAARVIMTPLRDPMTNELKTYEPDVRGLFGDVEF